MLTVQDFSLSYSQFALNIPFLAFPHQGLVLIQGNNGSGKSSLIRTLAGFHSHYQGSIFLNDTNIKDLSQQQIIKSLSYLPQIPSALPAITGQEYIEQGLYLEGEDQLSFLIDALKVTPLLPKLCHTMSGGERQLLTFIRNLALKKSLILLDEPDSFLSKSNKSLLAQLINKMSQNHLIICISHQYELYTPTIIHHIEEQEDNVFTIL